MQIDSDRPSQICIEGIFAREIVWVWLDRGIGRRAAACAGNHHKGHKARDVDNESAKSKVYKSDRPRLGDTQLCKVNGNKSSKKNNELKGKIMTQSMSSKPPADKKLFSVNFADELAPNETFVSATATISLKQGQAHDMSGMLVGTTLSQGTYLSQLIQGGLDGNYYYVTFSGTTNADRPQVISETFILPVAIQK